VAATAAVLLLPFPAAAQTFDAVGTRAAAMGGASVAVADDASAVYWNPAGFAFGSSVSLVVDRRDGQTDPPDTDRAGNRSSFLLAFGTPALGLSYYRLRTTSLVEVPSPSQDPGTPGQVQLDTLISQHTGVTFVQSLFQGLAVGTTVKLVRGVAATAIAVDGDRDALLDLGADLDGEATTKFDLDVGVMARFGTLKTGVTFRNLTEPSFETPGGVRRLTLTRQARAGVALVPGRYIVAADFDLLRTPGTYGDERVFAVGGEVHLIRQAVARAGLHLNTLSGSPDGTTYTLGGSYKVRGGILVDAQINQGSDRTERGWGLAARFVY